MKKSLVNLALSVLVVGAIAAPVAMFYPASSSPVSRLEEQRYCGEPARDAAGGIARRADVLRSFQRAHPCPVTGLTTGSCPGWSMDHVIPLVCGGCDSVSNLQWLPGSIKSAAAASGILPKDRFERVIYCAPFRTITPVVSAASIPASAASGVR